MTYPIRDKKPAPISRAYAGRSASIANWAFENGELDMRAQVKADAAYNLALVATGCDAYASRVWLAVILGEEKCTQKQKYSQSCCQRHSGWLWLSVSQSRCFCAEKHAYLIKEN